MLRNLLIGDTAPATVWGVDSAVLDLPLRNLLGGFGDLGYLGPSPGGAGDDALGEPLTLVQLRTRVALAPDDDSRDDYLAELVTAARQKCEHITGQILVPSTMPMSADAWPAGAWFVARPDVRGATAEVWTSAGWSPVALAPVDADAHGAYIAPLSGAWPEPAPRDRGARVRLQLQVGPAAAVDAPAVAKLYIGACVVHWFDNPAGLASLAEPNAHLRRLLDPLRFGRRITR